MSELGLEETPVNGGVMLGAIENPPVEETEEETSEKVSFAPYPVGANTRYRYNVKYETKDADNKDVTYNFAFNFKAFKNDRQVLKEFSALAAVNTEYNEDKSFKRYNDIDSEFEFIFKMCQSATFEGVEYGFNDTQSLPIKYKTLAVNEYLNFEVKAIKERDPHALMFDKKGKIKVKVVVGDEDSPRNVFEVTLHRPSDADIKDFSLSSEQPSYTVKDKITIQNNYLDHCYLVEKFDKYFSTAQNILIDEKSGDEEKTTEYIETTLDKDLNNSHRQIFLSNLCPFIKQSVYREVIDFIRDPLKK